jgi:hypothetical protein
MTGPTYAPARIVAPKLHAYFARHREETIARGDRDVGSLPDVGVIEAMIDAAFWASLRHEEGYIPKISLAYLTPQEAGQALTLERVLMLDPATLTRVAPAVERPGIHLGVWQQTATATHSERVPGVVGAGDLHVWGTTQHVPSLCFVLEVSAAGLLVVKHHRGDESGKYINVAVLEGDQIKVVDERASIRPDCPGLLTSLLGFEAPESAADSPEILVELAVSMRAHGRGGLLLLVPAGTEAWRESIVQPVSYAASPSYTELASLIQEDAETRRTSVWKDALDRAVAAVAGVTAVDGATLMTTRYELLAFGATVTRRKGSPPVEQVTVREPIEGDVATLVQPEQIGGTRHRAAAQFVQDQRDAVGLVASHDGRFTVFAWSPHAQMVHAHRIESLLL